MGSTCPGGSVTLFIGQASAGKTVFLHNLAFHLAEGKEFLGIAPVRPYKALYLDFESNEEIVVEHLRGIGFSERWHFFDPPESVSSGPALVELLDQMVREGQFDVVIIDPLIEAYPVKEENDNTLANAQMLAFRRLARSTGAGVILVHNSSTKKNRRGTAQGLSRGASAREDRADVVINFSSVNETTRKLNVVKSRTYNFGDEFKIQFSGDFGYEVLTAPAGSDAASTKRQSDILAFVENQKCGSDNTRKACRDFEPLKGGRQFRAVESYRSRFKSPDNEWSVKEATKRRVQSAQSRGDFRC